MSPPVGSTMRLIMRSSVVLPQPDEPTKHRRLARRDDEAEVLDRTRAVGELLGDALELDHWVSSVANPTDAGLECPNRCNGVK